MDLASVVAALASVGVRVPGSTPNSSVQVDSSRACPTGLAGPEPSGTINDPGQHFHIIPRHIQRAVGPFTVYAVPHPITAQCTHCNPRCALPCAGALQQPLPTPAYRGGIYLGTIPGDPHPYLLPAADRHHAIPLHLVEHLRVGPSPFQKRPPPHPIRRTPAR